MESLKPLATLVMSDKCFHEFFIAFNLFHFECLKQTISKCLGLGIIAGSLFVKIPQILKLIQSGSGAGISILGISLELLAITASAAYNYANSFPFSAWGEGLFLGIQTATIAFLVLQYGKGFTSGLVYVIIYGLLTYFLVGGWAPLTLLWTLQALTIPIVVVSKLIQGWTNYKNGGTGQLSAITVFILFLGSIARIFTSYQETGDLILILTYVATSAGNGLIAGQIIYYWNALPASGSKIKKNKKKNK
ncbi:hypothetical protein CHUAL_001492 [Chamberlinius hualienensis]